MSDKKKTESDRRIELLAAVVVAADALRKAVKKGAVSEAVLAAYDQARARIRGER